MLPCPQAQKWKKAQVEDQVDVQSYAVALNMEEYFGETEDT